MAKLKHLCLLLLISIAICEGLDEAGCGTTKFCFQYPVGCSSSNAECIFFTYYYNSSTDSFNMELSGGTGSNAYSSVGFASEAKMQDTDVYFCTGDKVLSGVIQDHYDHPILDSTIPKEITNVSASIQGGVASCSFTRASNIQRTVSGGTKKDFNLDRSSFYVLFAGGDMNSGVPKRHSRKGISASKVSFTLKSLSSECGKTVGCFQAPQGCEPGGECQFFSWVYDRTTNKFRFTMVGKAKSPNNYQSFAFTQVNSMQDADVYYCTSKKVGSAVIAARHSSPKDVPVQPSDISEIEFGVRDGAVICSFTRAASVNKTISTGVQPFDLTKQQYYVIYSTAVTSASGGITYHSVVTDRGVSTDEIDFTKFTGSGGSGGVGSSTKLIRAHAILMMISWMICANVGVVVARHYKPLWPDSTIASQKVWFQIHRFVMSIAFICTCLGIILIFVAIKGYSSDAGAHPIIGLIVTGLTFLNPIMAFYRPHPGTPKRKIFNAAHFTVGSSARVLAYAAIFLGLGLPLANVDNFTIWIMVGFVVNQVVAEIILEVLSALYGHVASYGKSQESAVLKGAVPKYLLLIYVIITNIGFTATLATYLVQG